MTTTTTSTDLSRSAADPDACLAPVRAEHAVLITTLTPSPSGELDLRPGPFPYAPGQSGWLAVCGGGHGDAVVEVAAVERDLVRTGVRLRAWLPASLELGLRGSWYRETLDDDHVDLLLGTADLSWRAFAGDRYAVRLGGGGRLSHDERGGLGGWNLSAGCDLYPVRPLSVELTVDRGTLGSADVIGFRAALGCHLRRVAVEIGWERTAIGEVVLDGPFAGLGISF